MGVLQGSSWCSSRYFRAFVVHLMFSQVLSFPGSSDDARLARAGTARVFTAMAKGGRGGKVSKFRITSALKVRIYLETPPTKIPNPTKTFCTLQVRRHLGSEGDGLRGRRTVQI